MAKQSKALTTLNTVRGLLAAQRDKIALALPKHLTPERMLRVASTAMERTPQLLECTPESLVRSIVVSSQLGLECDGVLGEGALVPYGKTCQFIPMYQGLVKLARNSGEIEDVYADVVYEGDEFSLERGLHPDLKHKPKFETENIVGFYAVAVFKSGYAKYEYLPKAKVDSVKARAKAKAGPWVTDYEEMGKKTAVIRLTKLLPKTAELQQAVAASNLAESQEDQSKAFDFDLPVGEEEPVAKPKPRELNDVLPEKEELKPGPKPEPKPEPPKPSEKSEREADEELEKRVMLRAEIEELFPKAAMQPKEWDDFVDIAAQEFQLLQGTQWQDFPVPALEYLIEGLKIKAKK